MACFKVMVGRSVAGMASSPSMNSKEPSSAFGLGEQ